MHLPVGVPVTLNHVSRRDPLVLGAGDPAQERHGSRAGARRSQLHAARDRTYQIICSEFCGVRPQRDASRYSSSSRTPAFDKWYQSWQSKNAHVSNALPPRRRCDQPCRRQAPTPARRSSRRSARPATRSRRSIRSSSGPGSKSTDDPAHPEPRQRQAGDAGEHRGDPAERLHRPHRHDAQRDGQRPLERTTSPTSSPISDTLK